MQIFKTCFFTKISKIELAFQADLFSNHIHMGGKNTLAATAIAVAITTSSPAFSNNPDTLTKETITCETKLACQKLTDSIQTQIEELKAKGLRKLSKTERRKFFQLNDQFIAVEKSETEKNSNLIATKNQKQEELKVANAVEDKMQSNLDSDDEKEKTLIEAKLKAQDAQIAGLRGALLEN